MHGDNGYSLLEVLFSFVLSTMVLLVGIGAWLASEKVYQETVIQSLEMHDEWIFWHALQQDMGQAHSVHDDNSTLTIDEDDGRVLTYHWSQSAGEVWRSVNGNGTAIVSFNVRSLRYSILPWIGLSVELSYQLEGVTDDAQFSALFAEGSA